MNQIAASNHRIYGPVILIAASIIVLLGRDLLDATQQQAKLKQIIAQQEQGVIRSRQVAASFEKMMRDLLQMAQTDADAKAIIAKYGIAINPPPVVRPK